MTQQTEWEKTYDRIKANAQKVDIIAEREAFEAYQQQCGLPIDSRYHDSETGYTDNLTGRAFDRWDAWLARAVSEKTAAASGKGFLGSPHVVLLLPSLTMPTSRRKRLPELLEQTHYETKKNHPPHYHLSGTGKNCTARAISLLLSGDYWR